RRASPNFTKQKLKSGGQSSRPLASRPSRARPTLMSEFSRSNVRLGHSRRFANVANTYAYPLRPDIGRRPRVRALIPHLHVAPWRVLDDLEPTAARLARGRLLGVLPLEPIEPVRPPRARVLGCLRKPFVDFVAAGFRPDPVLVFLLRRWIDH